MQEPLQPLPVPSFLTTLDSRVVLSSIFLMLAFVWLIYTLVATYHWLRYGHRSAVAIPVLIIYVVVSWLLASYAVSGFVA